MVAFSGYKIGKIEDFFGLLLRAKTKHKNYYSFWHETPLELKGVDLARMEAMCLSTCFTHSDMGSAEMLWYSEPIGATLLNTQRVTW